LQPFLIHTKLEGLTRDLLAFVRYLQVRELECSARWSFRSTQTHQQLDQSRETPAPDTEFSEQAGQTLAAHGGFFGSSSFALGQHIEFAVLLKQFHVYRIADCLPR
jgi:hypothetical protein